MVLESNQIVAIGAQVLLAKLHHGVRSAACPRIGQAHRLHGTEPQRFASAPGQLFDGQAGFEIRRPVRFDMSRHALAGEQRINEGTVLLAVERAVDVIVGAVERPAVARRAEGDSHVNGIRFHDRADAVVEEEALRAREPSDLGGECVAGERSAGDDGDAVIGNDVRFFAPQLDARLGGDGSRHFLGEYDAIHGERVSAGHSRDLRRAQE